MPSIEPQLKFRSWQTVCYIESVSTRVRHRYGSVLVIICLRVGLVCPIKGNERPWFNGRFYFVELGVGVGLAKCFAIGLI